MKITHCIFLILFSVSIYSQNKEALILYNEGVNYYNRKDYRLADSLFSKSITLEVNKDTYFSRALCRGKMADKKGYCEDLAQASQYGEEKATKLFTKTCGKIDTTYTKLDQNFTKTEIFSRVIKYFSGDSALLVLKHKYATQKSDSLIVVTWKPTDIRSEEDTTAQFPGGIPEMVRFVQMNLRFPRNFSSSLSVNRVYLRFIVFEDGTLHDIVVVKGALDCDGCDEEAIRVIVMMPRWRSAMRKGQLVKSYFNIPISFRRIGD